MEREREYECGNIITLPQEAKETAEFKEVCKGASSLLHLGISSRTHGARGH